MKLLTIKQAARAAGIDYETFLDIINDGRGPELHPDFRKPRRVSEENLERWVNKTEKASA